MKHSRPYRPGAWIALVLLLLGNLVPAFAGGWFCADGRACPWMNGVPSASSAASAPPSCCKAQAKRCCSSEAVPHPAGSRTASPLQEGSCRFVAAERAQEPAHLVRVERLTEPFDWALLPPLSASLFAAPAEARPDFPLPSPTFLPSSPHLAAIASRAPPLG